MYNYFAVGILHNFSTTKIIIRMKGNFLIQYIYKILLKKFELQTESQMIYKIFRLNGEWIMFSM